VFSTTGHTNAKSEARNLITEKVRRNAYDFHNFENYRLRLFKHRRLCVAPRLTQVQNPTLLLDSQQGRERLHGCREHRGQ
jgi:transposase